VPDGHPREVSECEFPGYTQRVDAAKNDPDTGTSAFFTGDKHCSYEIILEAIGMEVFVGS
jgi:hypothetical protein